MTKQQFSLEALSWERFESRCEVTAEAGYIWIRWEEPWGFGIRKKREMILSIKDAGLLSMALQNLMPQELSSKEVYSDLLRRKTTFNDESEVGP